LRGDSGLGKTPKPELIGPVLTHLHDTLQDSVRMAFLHSSRATGRIPASLKAAAQVRFVGHSASSNETTLLRFEVPQLGEAAAEWFQQTQFWEEGPKPDQTSFELLAGAVTDIKHRRKESNRFDTGLLRRVSSYRHMLKRGINSIWMPDTVQAVNDYPAIDDSTVSAASELSANTPPPRRVRIAGRLDLMGASQALLKVDLKPGVFVTALWQGALPVECLHEFFNRDVVIEGNGIFRPSGSLLRVDADAISPATAQDELFRKIPEPLVLRDYDSQIRLRPGERSPYARIFGSIPAEETDEEFAAAVERFS
jgi:hypothetical protein